MATVLYVVTTSGNTKIAPKNINIDGSDDAFYRYKMRQLFVQVVGRGKMIKTALLNPDDVAKDLRVPPAYLTAYFGYDIGAQSKYDAKKPDREKGWISGDREAVELSEAMKRFIAEVVLCPTCKLPELNPMNIEKKTKVFVQCRGCGTKNELNFAQDKFKQFVLNHPIKAVTSNEEKAVQQRQKEVTHEAQEESKNISNAEKKPSKSKKKVVSEMDEDDVEWSIDTSKEAVEQRRKEMLPDAVKTLASTDEDGNANANGNGDDEGKGNPCAELEEFYAANPDGDLVAEVKKLQEKYGFPNAKRSGLLFEVIFDGESFPDVKKYGEVFKGLIVDQASQLGLLSCIEKSSKANSALMKKLPTVLSSYYDGEILEEESILKWHAAKTTNAEVKKKAQPFIKWLSEAEEESEE